jgi:iron complex outermembrane receptor protein
MTTNQRMLALLLTSALAAPGVSWAADAAATGSTGTIEEVIVTAQRREESLQKVPVAVTAVTSKEVEKAGVASTDQLQTMVPGLVMTQQISASTPYLRGVGATQGGAGTEPTVSTYIDGVYIGPTLGGIFSFNNIDRIEVLKGPQGTLFGRNATGGLINVLTKTPGQRPELMVSAIAENYDRYSGNFYGSHPLGSDWAADLAIYGISQGKGFGRNVTLNQEINYRDEFSVRTKLASGELGKLKVTLSADYDWRGDDAGLYRNIFPGTVGLGGTHPAPNARDAQSDVPRRVNLTQGGVSAKLEYDLGFATLTSLTAFREYLTKMNYDQDNTPLRVVFATFHHSDKTYQQEFLLQGSTKRLNWTGGFFFFSDSTDLHLGIASAISPASNFLQQAYLTTDSYAVFGQVDYDLGFATKLSVGLRDTWDSQHFAGHKYATVGNPLGAGTIINGLAGADNSINKVTYKVSLDHQFTDDVMGYVLFSHGFKTGGYNINDVTQAPIRPETLDDVEGGVKSELFDHHLRLNLSAFHYDYKDIQVQSSSGGITQTLNASSGSLYGGEAEADLVVPVPVGDLRLRGTLAYLHAVYDSFPNSPIYVPAPAVCTPTPHSTGPAVGGNVTCVGNVSGNTMVRSPKVTATLSADYSVPVHGGVLDMSMDYYHSDSFYWQPDNRLQQPSYDTLAAQVSYTMPNGVRLRVFGKNLTNALYYYWGFSSSLGDGAYAADPRTYGVAVEYRF